MAKLSDNGEQTSKTERDYDAVYFSEILARLFEGMTVLGDNLTRLMLPQPGCELLERTQIDQRRECKASCANNGQIALQEYFERNDVTCWRKTSRRR